MKTPIALALAAAVLAAAPAAADPVPPVPAVACAVTGTCSQRGDFSPSGWPAKHVLRRRAWDAMVRGRYVEACQWALMATVRNRDFKPHYDAALLILGAKEREDCRRRAFEWRPGEE